MSLTMKHCAFFIIFCECFPFALLDTKDNDRNWDFLNQKVLDVSQNIEIKCPSLDIKPNFTKPRVANSHRRVFINNCPLNKTSFQNMMRIIEEQNIVELQMKLVKNVVDLFEDGLFKTLTSLTSLSITNCKIQVLNGTVFDGLKSISTLNVNLNNLENLTSDIFNSMQKLRRLDLSHNQLRHLPDGIFKPVRDLYTLRINFNCLNNLTRNLFHNLTNLRVLNLGNNDITHLNGDVFNEIRKLQNISISDNIICAFPETIFAKMNQLKKVFMSNASGPNNMTLPENLFANNTNLEILYLDNNNLITLPDSLFTSLSKLKKLRLNNNKLTGLSELIFKDNSNLEELYVNDNMLSIIERNTFRSLQKLIILDLRNNQLKSLDPNVFSSLTNLVTLNLANNQVNMSGLRPNVSNLHNCVKIENIYLSNNTVTQIYSDWFDEHGYLQNVDLSFNPLKQMDNLHFKSRNVNVNLTDNMNFEENLVSGMIMNDGQFNFHQLNNNQNYCPMSCTCWYNQDEECIVLDCRQVNIHWIQQFFGNLNQRINLINRLSNIEDVRVILSDNRPAALNLFKPLLENIHVTYLSLANSNLTDLNNLPVMYDLKTLNLDNNSLTSLSPPTIEKFQVMNNLNNITLFGNPWKCDCPENVDHFFEFLNSSSFRIFEVKKITCNGTGTSVLAWARSPKLCHQNYPLVSVIICVCIGCVGSISITWSCYRFRNEIKVWMFSHKIFRWLVTEKEIDRDKLYDAFVSYSHLDEWFVANELVPELEGGPNPYKLCIHYRDWLAGDHIPTQIHRSVKASKRTIIVLSPNFLASFWAKIEFHEAYIKAMKERCPRVIVILLRDIDDQVKLDDELKVYLRTYTYIKWHDSRFWSKLKYALPHKQISKAKLENF